MTRKALFAVAMVLAMVGAPLTGAVAAADSADAAGNLSVGVAQDDDGEVTVSVTRNETGVANASVLVETVDENDTYAGDGEYTTDDDGEVDLPAPDENVTVNVTAEAGNDTAMTTAELLVVEENETDSFGQRVSAFVHALQDDDNVTRLGPHVAAFVTANNPGNAPDHAGPPAFVFGDDADDSDDNETADDGSTETADTGDEDDERGPPAHAGPPDDRGDDDGDEADDADDGADEEEGDDGEDEEDDSEDDEDDDGERGPPEGAGPPGHAGR